MTESGRGRVVGGRADSSAAVGSEIRRLRVAAGLTQRALADPLYNHTYVSSIESGRRQPSPQALEHFSRKLGVPIARLQPARLEPIEVMLELEILGCWQALLIGVEEAQELAATFGRLVGECRRFDLHRLADRARMGIGAVHERSKDFVEAERVFEEVERSAEGATPINLVEPRCARARCRLALGDELGAIQALEQLRAELEESGLAAPDAMKEIFLTSAAAYDSAGLIKKSGEMAVDALALSHPRDERNAIETHLRVAEELIGRGAVSDARLALHRASDALRDLELLPLTVRSMFLTAKSELREGAATAAARRLESARALLHATKEPKLEIELLLELSRLARRSGDSASGLAHAKEAESLLQQIPQGASGDLTAVVLFHMGVCLSERDPSLAKEKLHAALELLDGRSRVALAAETYLALADLESDAKETERLLRTGLEALVGRGESS